MNLIETLGVALRDLALHKFRSALATLGIIFGVASVEAMVSISEGARSEALGRITALGVDNIMIRSMKPTDAGPEQRAAILRRYLPHVADGSITIPLARTFPLHDWREAVAISLSGNARGKLVLQVR